MSDPKIKIVVPKGTEESDVNDFLYKATSMQINGDVHGKESFDDPAMIDAANQMLDVHKNIYTDMILEIIQVLEEEYE